MIPISKPWLGAEEEAAVLEVLRSGQLTKGFKTTEFEQAFANYIGTRHAIAVSSGTAALHLALLACQIQPGAEVITTSFTFIATINMIKAIGAKPVFVDIRPDTFNIDETLIEAAITDKTDVVLPVHLFGMPCNMSRIMEIAGEHKLLIVEDACQSHGASIGNRKVGTFGNAACFSFYPSKNMTTGEGGMVTTDSDYIANAIRELRDHRGEIAYNYRMTEIQAAIGIEQLKRLTFFNTKRFLNAQYLARHLGDCVIVPEITDGHVFNQFTVRVPEGVSRHTLQVRFEKSGIDSKVYYSQLPDYNCPEATRASKEVLSLPVHPGLTTDDLDKIVEAVREALNGS